MEYGRRKAYNLKRAPWISTGSRLNVIEDGGESEWYLFMNIAHTHIHSWVDAYITNGICSKSSPGFGDNRTRYSVQTKQSINKQRRANGKTLYIALNSTLPHSYRSQGYPFLAQYVMLLSQKEKSLRSDIGFSMRTTRKASMIQWW